MSIRYWVAAVAFGLVGIVQSGQAQEETDNEQGQARQQERPAHSYPLPFPIEIIEDQTDADARKRREAEARQREIDDLIAQQGMNEATRAMNKATQEMRDYAYAQTWLVGIGTVLLFGTLWFAWQGNKAAFRAVNTTKDIGDKQLRAYVHVGVNVTSRADHFEIKVTGTNHGQTPAYNVCAVAEWTDEPFDPSIHFPNPPDRQSRGSVGPGAQLVMQVLTNESHIPERRLSEDQCRAILVGEAELNIYGRIDYEDAFRVARWVTFRHRFKRKGAQLILSVAEEGNDSN